MTCCSYCGKPRVVSHNWTSLWSQSRIDSLCSMDDASMAGKEGRRGGKEARRKREGDELGTGALRLLADLDSLRLSQSERRQQPRSNSVPRRLSPCPGASLPATRDFWAPGHHTPAWRPLHWRAAYREHSDHASRLSDCTPSHAHDPHSVSDACSRPPPPLPPLSPSSRRLMTDDSSRSWTITNDYSDAQYIFWLLSTTLHDA